MGGRGGGGRDESLDEELGEAKWVEGFIAAGDGVIWIVDCFEIAAF